MNELKTKPGLSSTHGDVRPLEEEKKDQRISSSATEVKVFPHEARQSPLVRFAVRLTAAKWLIAGDVVVATCFAIWWEQWTWPLLVGWLMSVMSWASSGLYRPRLHLALLDQLPQLMSQFFIAMTVALTVPALFGVPLELRRHAAGAALMITAMLVIRGSIFAVIRVGRGAGSVAHPTLIVGNGERARKVVEVLGRHRAYGLNVLGYVADRPTEDAGGAWNYLGDFEDLADVVRKHHIEILILDETTSHRRGLVEGLRHGSSAPTTFVLTQGWDRVPGTTGDHIGGVPIMRVSRGLRRGQQLGKRMFDIAMAMLSLALLSPLMITVALAVMAEDGHGPLFKQVRVGRNGKLFTMYKFRSMRPVAKANSDTQWSGDSEARISRIGKFIRATSIDELPQLFNILRGDMTFVGPRPERPHYVDKFSAMFPEYESRHRVTVGLTGLAQVSGLRGDTSIDDRVRHDNYYIDHWSLWFDIKVLIWTLGQAFGARGS
ncbi:sugar transferase [Actinoplanes sp. N902-109]|uniref:sugar transferase n=1 Tax=Actinoplanes sp. (strain N902-109) TaxID=649831 RepID=UPI0003293724|nr:sugar transferase [Actinoplanes sp. N902-109]AGL20847.1 exopolysaccharide biosynthesis polyprenyl glycosylphosphotransferase [Actinoplanes sp. N902-109]